MSAWMCDDCHLTALAAFAVKHCLSGVRDVDLTEAKSVDRVRIMLGRENVASLRHRYPSHCNPDYVGKSCAHAMARAFAPAEILKAADCYAYQACEHPGWRSSAAYLLILKIRQTALDLSGWRGKDPAQLSDSNAHNMPGYEEAAWGLDCSHDITPIVEDRDDYHARWLAECRAHGETQRKLEALNAGAHLYEITMIVNDSSCATSTVEEVAFTAADAITQAMTRVQGQVPSARVYRVAARPVRKAGDL